MSFEQGYQTNIHNITYSLVIDRYSPEDLHEHFFKILLNEQFFDNVYKMEQGIYLSIH